MAKDSQEKKKTKRPTAQKRVIQGEKRRLLNKSFSSKVKTALRRFHEAVKTGESTSETLNTAYSSVDKAVKRGLYKQNKGDRIKARLANKLKATA